MKKIKKKYIKPVIWIIIILIITIVVSIVLMANDDTKKDSSWLELIVLPIVISLSTSGLISVWFTYKNESERFVEGLQRELDEMSIYNFGMSPKILNVFHSPFIPFEVRETEISRIILYKTNNYFIRVEYPEMCDFIYNKYKELSKKIIKKENNDNLLNTYLLMTTTGEILQKINDTIENFKKVYNNIKTKLPKSKKADQ